MRVITLTIVAMLLAGCATVVDPRLCPVERKYTRAEQDQFLDDFDKTPKSIQGALVDYGKLRDAARACRGERAR